MITAAKIIITIASCFLLLKLKYAVALEKMTKSRTSLFLRVLFGSLFFVALPIIRRPHNREEKKIIQRANLFLGTFYIFFFIAILIVAIA